jgi:hypothetical protein
MPSLELLFVVPFFPSIQAPSHSTFRFGQSLHACKSKNICTLNMYFSLHFNVAVLCDFDLRIIDMLCAH